MRLLAAFFVALTLAFPARAQYLDGLPAAGPIQPGNIVIVCQNGTLGVPGTCTTAQTTVSAIQSGITASTPIQASGTSITNILGVWMSYLAGISNPNPVVLGNSLVVGSPTGGSKGAGSINAQSIFINGVAVSAGGTVVLPKYTIGSGASQIPVCSSSLEGQIVYVTDAAAIPVYNATQVGGGSAVLPVFCNGSNWTNH
jgi:hypothetical protein